MNLLNKVVMRKDNASVGVVYRDTGNGILGVIVISNKGVGHRRTWLKSKCVERQLDLFPF